jgi:hypothetical protein
MKTNFMTDNIDRKGLKGSPTHRMNWLKTRPRLEWVMSNSGRSYSSGFDLERESSVAECYEGEENSLVDQVTGEVVQASADRVDEKVDDENPVHFLTNRRLPAGELVAPGNPEH